MWKGEEVRDREGKLRKVLAALDPFAPNYRGWRRCCVRVNKGTKGLASRKVGVGKKKKTVDEDGWNTYAPEALKDYQITSTLETFHSH